MEKGFFGNREWNNGGAPFGELQVKEGEEFRELLERRSRENRNMGREKNRERGGSI